MGREKIYTPEVKAGHPEFYKILKEMAELHYKKSSDYGVDKDPLANLNGALDWGMSPLQGIFLRIGDKIKRLQTYAVKGSLQNEGVEDTLLDLACYAILGLVVLREDEDRDDESKEISDK
jgi:hypothetical protein